MAERPLLATGFLKRTRDGLPQAFTLHLVTQDAVELRFGGTSFKVILRVERIAEFEIKRAIEKKFDGEMAIDFRAVEQ